MWRLIDWSRLVLEGGSIAGKQLAPFFTKGYEGYDLNDESDWTRMQELAEKDHSLLPTVDCGPIKENND